MSEVEGIVDSAFDDLIIGDANENWISLSSGNDHADGGAGFDVVFYSEASGSVSINLTTGQATVDSGGLDTVLNFEAAQTGNFADDVTLTDGDNYAIARAGNDVIYGYGGSDFLVGGSGSDTLDGGDGFDTASYFENEGLNSDAGGPVLAGVVVDLSTGTATDGWGDTDTLNSIEAVWGTNFADILSGSSENNHFTGLGGNDWIAGGTGNDTMVGGEGADIFVFSNGGGADEIGDFSFADADKVDLSSFANVNTYADVQGLMQQLGADVVLDFGGGDLLTVRNTLLTSFTSDAFLF